MQERTSVLLQATPPAMARPRLPGGFGPLCQASRTWMGGEETRGPRLPRAASPAWDQCPDLPLTSCLTTDQLLTHTPFFLSVKWG